MKYFITLILLPLLSWCLTLPQDIELAPLILEDDTIIDSSWSNSISTWTYNTTISSSGEIIQNDNTENDWSWSNLENTKAIDSNYIEDNSGSWS